MRAKMLVDARIVGDPDLLLREGQVVEGADAELQVGLGQAEELSEEGALEASREVQATQAALDHAQTLGIDISAIMGTGKDGKVTKADVEAAVAAKEKT
jgi:pyruvate/2-oxoglutarate dehydrogenase complex dihydrolipoamide acyltransferase (E2) component